jgi:glycosyltransferase involved in cell wall biosynthesis
MSLISFILPTINPPNSLSLIINSIEKRFKTNYELIIINDNPDNKLLFDEFKCNSQYNISVITNSFNSGPGYSRNIGIMNAQFDYIAFVDDDDQIEYYNNDQLFNAINSGADIIFADFKDSSGVFSNSQILTKFQNNLKLCKSIFIENLVKLDFHPWQCQQFLFNNKFLKSNSLLFLNLYIAEDIAFNTEAIIKSKNISIISGQYYNYNSRSGTLKSSIGIDRARDCLNSLLHIYNLYLIKKNIGLDSDNVFLKRSIEFLSNFFIIRLLLIGEIDNNLSLIRCEEYDNIFIEDFYDMTKIKLTNNIYYIREKIINDIKIKISIKIDKIDKLFIYCAGTRGRAFAHVLDKLYSHLEICFIDDNPNIYDNKICDAYNVLSLDEINSFDNSIIIICNPQLWIEEIIFKKLKDHISILNIDNFHIELSNNLI